MKVLLLEFRQETNSFNPTPCTMESFERGGILNGAEIIDKLSGRRCAIMGMHTALKEAGAEIIPGCSMVSQRGGIIEQGVIDQFLRVALQQVNDALPLDGVFVSMHGATQSSGMDDVCGEILAAVRKATGERTVICGSCDMHANVTELMLKNADFICGYHTYPHQDYFEVGYRAASLGIRQIHSPALHMAAVHIPMIVPASGYTTQSGIYKDYMDSNQKLVDDGVLVDFSVFQMQPWLDVPVGGSSIMCVSEDAAVAKACASRLAQRLMDMRTDFKPQLYTIDQVIDIAESNTTKQPVILVDSADSTNAGASGDSMAVVRRLLERGSRLKAASVVDDPPAANLAHRIGAGQTVTISLGGTKDPVHSGKPLKVEAYIKSLHDGVFVQEGPAGKGLVNNIGPTAVLSVGNIDIVVCHGVAGNGDPQLYRAFGVEPLNEQLVVVKACTSFRSAYCNISDLICLADTPGSASADLLSFTFKKVPKSFYPFSSLKDHKLAEPQCFRG